MRGTLIGLGAVLALAASCDDGAPPRNFPKIKVAENSIFQQRLQKMDPRLRNATFMRAIRDSGESCNRVVQSSFTGLFETLPMWSARCSGGSEWAIFIAADGGIQLRECGQMQQLGLPACRFETATPDGPVKGNSSAK